jgi:uncharacterized protein YjbI with pentapeptide repeats
MNTLTRKKVLQIVKSAQERGRRPDLSGADLHETDLSGAYLGGAYLIGANLIGANLNQANFTGANLSQADLNNAHLRGAKLGEAYLSQAKLGHANLIGAHLNRTHLIGADLSETNLSGAYLSQTDLSGANLSGACLSGVDLSQANLVWADFSEANLDEADLNSSDFSEACLKGASLFRANLSNAGLFRADLTGTDLSQANLIGADLCQAKLTAANLSQANLSRVKVDEADFGGAIAGMTFWGDIDLSVAQGLDSMLHRAPSTLGVDALSRSAGQIPEAFLRGCGLSDVQIETARFNNPHLTFDQIISITTTLHEWLVEPALPTCFITFAGSDEAFARQLHADLQHYGVRCWLAPEDGLQAGNNIRPLDPSVRYHDKLLVALSAQSLGSDWIKQEVKAVLQEEERRGELVLYPLHLDDTLLESGPAWVTGLHQSRPVEDFCQWQDAEMYQYALARLLQDLVTAKDL